MFSVSTAYRSLWKKKNTKHVTPIQFQLPPSIALIKQICNHTNISYILNSYTIDWETLGCNCLFNCWMKFKKGEMMIWWTYLHIDLLLSWLRRLQTFLLRRRVRDYRRRAVLDVATGCAASTLFHRRLMRWAFQIYPLFCFNIHPVAMLFGFIFQIGWAYRWWRHRCWHSLRRQIRRLHAERIWNVTEERSSQYAAFRLVFAQTGNNHGITAFIVVSLFPEHSPLKEMQQKIGWNPTTA